MIALMLALQIAAAPPYSLEQIDLKAAYCVGRLKSVAPLSFGEQAIGGPSAQEASRELENAKQRLRAYLIPRTNQRDNVDALLAADHIGVTDQAAYTELVRRCYAAGENMGECLAGPLTNKFVECRKAEFLPF